MTTTQDSLLKFEIPEIIFGQGALSQVGQCARRLGGEHILLVTDPGIQKAVWVDAAIRYFDEEGLRYSVFDDVVTNPRTFQVEHGAQLYHQDNCDVIVALGGGSPMDVAKGVAILVTNHGRIQDYVGCNLITQPIPPLLCVPTTAGTGSDVSQFSVIADTQRKVKMTILSRAIMADISLIDPVLLTTKSEELIAATGMDALTHAIEAYVSSLSWPLTDPHAIHAIQLVFKHLEKAARSKDIDAFEGMAIASLEAGIAFSNAILGAVHALAHPLGGIYDLHHGLANAILLPVVVRENMEHAPEKFAKIANAMGAETRGVPTKEAAEQVPEKIEGLISALGLPRRLSQVGVQETDIPLLAKQAAEDLCMQTNPHCYIAEEIESMYIQAL
ncbi:Alcohol dehydrogenase (EC [Olavius algarvensis associated proteobacterium Delta 3]|nr:Alcohol dehydrogenase (EC [Olavius algarvensis associated proteobacterium Delta 3]